MAEVTKIGNNLRNKDWRTPYQQLQDINTLTWAIYTYMRMNDYESELWFKFMGDHFETGRGTALVINEQSKNIAGEEKLRWYQLRYGLVINGLHWQNPLFTLEEDGVEIVN